MQQSSGVDEKNSLNCLDAILYINHNQFLELDVYKTIQCIKFTIDLIILCQLIAMTHQHLFQNFHLIMVLCRFLHII